jgi:hypothetical protein
VAAPLDDLHRDRIQAGPLSHAGFGNDFTVSCGELEAPPFRGFPSGSHAPTTPRQEEDSLGTSCRKRTHILVRGAERVHSAGHRSAAQSSFSKKSEYARNTVISPYISCGPHKSCFLLVPAGVVCSPSKVRERLDRCHYHEFSSRVAAATLRVCFGWSRRAATNAEYSGSPNAYKAPHPVVGPQSLALQTAATSFPMERWVHTSPGPSASPGFSTMTRSCFWRGFCRRRPL